MKGIDIHNFSVSQIGTIAGPTAQLSGAVSSGPLCVEGFDAGNDADPVSYSVAVSHP